MPAQRRPPTIGDEPPAGCPRPGPRAAEAMLSPQALLGWGTFASTVAALTVVVLQGTMAHALAVAALGLSATVLLGWLAGPPDAPAARAVARVRRAAVPAQVPAAQVPAAQVPAAHVPAAQDAAELEIVDLRHLDRAEGQAGAEASGDSSDSSDVLDLTRTDAGRADR